MNPEHRLDQLLADEKECPEELSPARDLWPGIEQAINQQQQQAKPGLSINKKIALSSAASVCAAVLLIQMLMPGGLLPSPAQNNGAGIDALVATYEQEKQDMLVRVKGQPVYVADWQQQLQELEQAASSLRSALKEEPNNAVLIRMLGNVYQQQLDLINKVHAPQWQQI